MNVTFNQRGTSTMGSTSNKHNMYSGDTLNHNNGKPQFGGCAVVVALIAVAVVIFTVVIPALGGFQF